MSEQVPRVPIGRIASDPNPTDQWARVLQASWDLNSQYFRVSVEVGGETVSSYLFYFPR